MVRFNGCLLVEIQNTWQKKNPLAVWARGLKALGLMRLGRLSKRFVKANVPVRSLLVYALRRVLNAVDDDRNDDRKSKSNDTKQLDELRFLLL